MQYHFARLVAATIAAFGVALSSLSSASAIVLYGPTDTKYIAPTGEYASIPWGTYAYDASRTNPVWAISENWALRAHHVSNNATGYSIVQNGVSYNVVQAVQVAGTDLELVRVDQPFSSFFHMYDGSDEVGKDIVMFGANNSGKGGEIHAEVTNRFNGWTIAGPSVTPGPGESGNLAWGRNQISDVVDVEGTSTLYATFDAPTLPDGSVNPNSVGSDEAIAYSGDSGGAFFIQQAGEWRIGGIIYAVDTAYYSQDTPKGNYLFGAVTDARDLWADFYIDPNNPSAGTERRLITGTDPVPFGTYASRVSQYRGSIDTITGQTAGLGVVVVPETGTGRLALLGMGCLGAGIFVARRRTTSIA